MKELNTPSVDEVAEFLKTHEQLLSEIRLESVQKSKDEAENPSAIISREEASEIGHLALAFLSDVK